MLQQDPVCQSGIAKGERERLRCMFFFLHFFLRYAPVLCPHDLPSYLSSGGAICTRGINCVGCDAYEGN